MFPLWNALTSVSETQTHQAECFISSVDGLKTSAGQNEICTSVMKVRRLERSEAFAFCLQNWGRICMLTIALTCVSETNLFGDAAGNAYGRTDATTMAFLWETKDYVKGNISYDQQRFHRKTQLINLTLFSSEWNQHFILNTKRVHHMKFQLESNEID